MAFHPTEYQPPKAACFADRKGSHGDRGSPAYHGRLRNFQPQAADRSICFEGVRQGLPGEQLIRIKLQIMVGIVKRKEAFDLGAQDDFEIARTLENLVAE